MSSKSSKKQEQKPEELPVFNEAQIAEFKESFGVFDKDHDGRINPQEMCALLSATGFNESQREVSDYCAQIDKTGENLFDFDEYVSVAEYFNGKIDTAEVIRSCLSVFFPNSLTMGANDLSDILTKIGDPLTTEEVKHLFYNIKSDGNGTIDISSFVNTIAGIPEPPEDE